MEEEKRELLEKEKEKFASAQERRLKMRLQTRESPEKQQNRT